VRTSTINTVNIAGFWAGIRNWDFWNRKFLPSLPLALQLRVSFGLLNNQPPFLSVFICSDDEASNEEVRRMWMEEGVAHLFSLILYSFHPSKAHYLVPEQFSFYGVRLLVSRPIPNLEDQGIPLRVAPTPCPVRHG
jgi:hypothetical protein